MWCAHRLLAWTGSGVGWPAPLGGPAQGWDPTPIAAAFAAILVWRFGLRRAITWSSAGGAVLVGLAVATAADTVGLLPTLAVTTILACLAVLRRPDRRPR